MENNLLSAGRAVQLSDIREFLRLKGWEAHPHKNQKIELFRPNQEGLPPIEFVIPRSADAADFSRRVVDAATSLATLFHVTPEMVIAQIRDVSKDILNTRFVSEENDQDSIALERATLIVEGLKKFLTYASTGEISALPFFNKPLPRAIKNVQRCRFGHTFRGSFGFTVESPLLPMVGSLWPDEVVERPYERRVIERIYRGLKSVDTAKQEHSIDALVNNYESGLNANMCDALVDMSEGSSGELSFSVRWSPKIPEEKASDTVAIDHEAIEYVKAARIQLRRLEEARDVTIEGRVVLLKSDSQPWEDEPEDEHTVVISWIDVGGKAVKTRLVLSPENYLTACNAHMQGRAVSVSGRLERRGKYTRLLNPQGFRLGSQFNLFL